MDPITDLEARLSGPQAAQARTDLLAQLADLEHRWHALAATRLPRDEHLQVAALADAARAARQVVRQWRAPEPPAASLVSPTS